MSIHRTTDCGNTHIYMEIFIYRHYVVSSAFHDLIVSKSRHTLRRSLARRSKGQHWHAPDKKTQLGAFLERYNLTRRLSKFLSVMTANFHTRIFSLSIWLLLSTIMFIIPLSKRVGLPSSIAGLTHHTTSTLFSNQFLSNSWDQKNDTLTNSADDFFFHLLKSVFPILFKSDITLYLLSLH